MGNKFLTYSRILIIIILTLHIFIPTEITAAKTTKILPEMWGQKAEEGDAYYQALFGASLRCGYFHKKNHDQGLKWIKQAVEQDSPLGYFNLAEAYDYGQGVKKDKEKAKELYDKALDGLLKQSKKRDTYAQFSLAKLYQSKTANLKKEKQLLKLIKQSAARGNAVSQAELAEFYYKGTFVKKNEKQAFVWYKKSAEQNLRSSIKWLAYLYEHGKGTKENINKAVKWYTLGAELEHGTCVNKLGSLYENGKGVEKDLKKAADLYKKALELENKRGIYNLALLYEKGKGVKKDIGKAEELFAMSAKMEHKKAKKKCLEYAKNYIKKSKEFNQKSLEARENKDYNLAKDYAAKNIEQLRMAAKLGDANSQILLGQLLLEGKDADHDYAEALKWFKKAARQDNPSSVPMKHLGYMYQQGLGVPKDYDKALKWLNKAKSAGDKDAKNYIKTINREIAAKKIRGIPELYLFNDALPFDNFAFFEVTPDGKYIVTSAIFETGDSKKELAVRNEQKSKGVIFIWDAQTGELINRIGQDIQSYTVSMSPDGNLIAGLKKDYQWIEIIAIPSGYIKHRLLNANGEINLGGIHFAKDNKHLFISDFNPETEDNTIRLFKIESGSIIKTIYEGRQGKDYNYMSLDVHNDNNYLTFVLHDYSGTNNGMDMAKEIRMLIDSEDASNFYRFKEKTNSVPELCFSPTDNLALLFGYDKRDLEMWDIENKKVIFDNMGNASKAAFHPDGNYFVTSHKNGRYDIWLKKDAKIAHIFRKSSKFNEITMLSFAPDGRSIYITGKIEKELRVAALPFDINIDVKTLDEAFDATTKILKAFQLCDVGFKKEAFELFSEISNKYAMQLFDPDELNRIIKAGMPLLCIGDLCLKAHDQEKQIDDKGDKMFYPLIRYALFAAYSGHPELTLQAVEKINSLLENIQIEQAAKKYITDINVALEALALIQSSQETEAYGLMVKHETFGESAKKWILSDKYWAPLHKDRKKLAFILGLNEEDFITNFDEPEIAIQAYPDINGNIIRPGETVLQQ
ncbi:MAG: hypothetical protein GY853_05485 [PVC group bacterium]|nr:hypothetical protein [PVC group bacterium]